MICFYEKRGNFFNTSKKFNFQKMTVASDGIYINFLNENSKFGCYKLLFCIAAV